MPKKKMGEPGEQQLGAGPTNRKARGLVLPLSTPFAGEVEEVARRLRVPVKHVLEVLAGKAEGKFGGNVGTLYLEWQREALGTRKSVDEGSVG